MKKLIAAATAAAAMTLGGVALTAPVANAAPECSTASYSGCTRTVTNADLKPKTNKRGSAPVVRVTVRADGSTLTPTGKMTITIKRVGGGYSDRTSTAYNGGTVKIAGKKITKAGNYKVKAIFDSNPNGIFADSTDTFRFDVK